MNLQEAANGLDIPEVILNQVAATADRLRENGVAEPELTALSTYIRKSQTELEETLQKAQEAEKNIQPETRQLTDGRTVFVFCTEEMLKSAPTVEWEHPHGQWVEGKTGGQFAGARLYVVNEQCGDLLIKSHIKQYTRQDGTVVTEHDDKRTKKHQDLLAHQNTHEEEIHSGAKLQHGKELIDHLRGRGWKEKETHQVKPTSGAVGGKKEDMPEHEEIKAKNRDNGALQTAERSMKKMREAAMNSDDPVSVLKNINTSRSNTYTAAIDDYREKLLNHLGHSVDRNKTATKFEKDGHSIIMSQEGSGHTVHFAGGDPDKAKDAITSIQGKKEVQSVDTGKKEPKFVMGDDDKSYTAKMNPVHSKFALVEADDLTASHTIQGHINKAYPQEIQPRERERLSSQMQMANIMNDIKPELFTGTGMAAHGSPIVGKDGAVESGNGRTIALIEAYKRDLAGNYKEHIAKTAKKYGLKKEDVEKMKSPVLVRVRDDDDPNTNRAEFAREANDTGNLGSSPAEQAWSDSERIDDNLLKKFTVDEDGEIYNDDNMDFINGFLDKLGKNESAGLRDADGDPNKKAIERIQNAVFTKVYGSSVLTELQTESAKPKIRNVLKALNGCVGDFAQIKGHDDLDVVPDMMEAIEYTLSHQNQSKAELEHTLRNAGSLDFTGDSPKFKTDHAIDMILAISDRAGSRNRLENVFRAISNGIKDEVASRDNPEVDMFSGPAEPKTKEQVVKQAIAKVNSSDDVKKSFHRPALTHLIKSLGGTNGRIKRRGKVREEVGTLEKSAHGCGQDGCCGQSESCRCQGHEEAGEGKAEKGAIRKGQDSKRACTWLIKSKSGLPHSTSMQATTNYKGELIHRKKLDVPSELHNRQIHVVHADPDVTLHRDSAIKVAQQRINGLGGVLKHGDSKYTVSKGALQKMTAELGEGGIKKQYQRERIAAIQHLPELIDVSQRVPQYGDDGRDKSVKDIVELYAPFQYGGKIHRVRILAKEYLEEPKQTDPSLNDRLHSLKIEDIVLDEKSPGAYVPEALKDGVQTIGSDADGQSNQPPASATSDAITIGQLFNLRKSFPDKSLRSGLLLLKSRQPSVTSAATSDHRGSNTGKQFACCGSEIVLEKSLSGATKLLKRFRTGSASGTSIDIAFHDTLQKPALPSDNNKPSAQNDLAKSHHCTINTCPQCGSVQTCRCRSLVREETNELCWYCQHPEENSNLQKAHVAAYDRTTKSGALAHIDAHEDSRVKRYAIKLARTENSHQLHKLRQERFAHLPHWGTLDEPTKQSVLDAEDEVHAGHKHWEEWKAEHGSGKGKQKANPMAEHLPGDHSGLLQTGLFKARRYRMYLLKTKRPNGDGKPKVTQQPIKKSLPFSVAHILKKATKNG